MWVQQQSGEVLDWTYGRITFLKSPYQTDQSQITILANPFNSTAPNTLSFNLRSQDDKNFQTVEKILNFLVERKAVRSSKVILKGGGLLLDVGGFACSIYMRGISDVIYMPTTLLAMVDATVGGKTGINFGSAKNIVGNIKHPSHVIIDLKNLQTLSDREFRNGLAEVIKMAATYDQSFFLYLQSLDLNSLRKRQGQQKLRYIIKKSLEIKIKVVQKDQWQKHERKWLNFGHTIGHAIQLSSGHSLLHGECVAIGMVAVLELFESSSSLSKRSIISRMRKILKSFDLPTQIPSEVDLLQMKQLLLKDKKKLDSSDCVEFVMIEDIGIPESTVRKISIDKVLQYFSKQVQIKQIKNLNASINQTFPFPSSKSISLRFAYIAALSLLKFKKPITILNFLESDDTKWMLHCLNNLGFKIEHNQTARKLVIGNYQSKQTGVLNIGNSGITARIILPLCASLEGEWIILCHPRMSQRPNREIIRLCQQQFNCQFEYLQKQYGFPLILKVKQTHFGLRNNCIKVNGKQSSQFITSMMIYGAFFHGQFEIETQEGEVVSQSYIQMTAQCLRYLDGTTKFTGKNIILSQVCKYVDRLTVQTDLSSLSYPYIFSKLHKIAPPKLPAKSMQGDLLFYRYLQQLSKTKERSIRLDFNNCTDTFMTLAAFIVQQSIQQSTLQSITIFNIANQRSKQSNRIHLIIKNLRKVGIKIEQYENEIKIFVKFQVPRINTILFQSANDHRLAMSLAILSTYLKKLHPSINFIIDDKHAVNKTFPQFWQYLKKAGLQTAPYLLRKKSQQALPFAMKIILVGDRGSGKSTLGKNLAIRLNIPFIDLDEKITQEIESLGEKSIENFVNRNGWVQFRRLQSRLLQQYLTSKECSEYILATGGGILEQKINVSTLQRHNSCKIYIERQFDQLRIESTSHRPSISNYRQVSTRRSTLYQSIATIILNIPPKLNQQQQANLLFKNIDKFYNHKTLKQGIILTVNQIPKSISETLIDPNQLSSIELRLDELIERKVGWKYLRRKISVFQHQSSIDTILTLRTVDQLGSFSGDYMNFQNQVRKIPTQFLDHQFVYPINYGYNFNKMILSYHGQNQSIIKKLSAIDHFRGIKKLCMRGTYKHWEEAFKGLGSNNICINLDDPTSRLYNKYQFAVMEQSKHNRTGIMTFNQMKILNTFKKVLLKK